MDTVSDDILLEQIVAGDEHAFATLVTRYSGRLARMAMVFVKNRAVAEELVQESWIAVLDHIPSFERRASLKTWLYTIIVNRAKDRAAREQRVVPFSALGDDPTADPGSSPNTPAGPKFSALGLWNAPPSKWGDDGEGLLLRKEAREELTRAIEALPANQRAVVILRDVEGRSAEEVCNILEISESNQRVLLHRARTRLRDALEELMKASAR
jgi:RNA polymerase sigma-70 factor, ECF subfamily